MALEAKEVGQQFTLIKSTLDNIITMSEGLPSSIVEEVLWTMLDIIKVGAEKFWKDSLWNKDNISYNFSRRIFNKLEDPKVIKTEAQQKIEKVKKDYDLEPTAKMEMDRDYVDEGSTHLSNKGVHLYQVLPHRFYNQLDVNPVFSILARHRLYRHMAKLYCWLVVSREYTHLVLNNEHVLELMQAVFVIDPLREKCLYYTYYGFYMLFKEECILKSKVKSNDRCCFDIETARLLPKYHGPLERNPYVPLTLSDKYMNLWHDQVVRPLVGEWGIVSLEEFKERFRIASGGLFEGVDMDRLYVTGSIIAECVIRNPLETIHPTFESYDNEYYPSMDCTDDYNKCSDIDVVVDLSEDGPFTKKCEEILAAVQKTYPEAKLIELKTKKSFRFKIYGDGMKRCIELFRTYIDPIATISRFHFPCVRGYYDGRSVKLLSSLVAGAMSGFMPDWKWMASTHIGEFLVAKYFSRGFGMFLNAREHYFVIQYMIREAKWHYALGSIPERGQPMDPNNPIYKPRKVNKGIHAEMKPSEKTDSDYLHIILVQPHSDELPPFRQPSGHIKALENLFV